MVNVCGAHGLESLHINAFGVYALESLHIRELVHQLHDSLEHNYTICTLHVARLGVLLRVLHESHDFIGPLQQCIWCVCVGMGVANI